MHSNGVSRRRSLRCLYTAIGFSIFVGQSTPAQILLDRFWPNLDSSTSSKTLLEMISLLNTQWLSDPSTQWLYFLTCDWNTFLDAIILLSQDELSIPIIRFWKFVIVASREMKIIFDAISFQKLLQILVKAYLKYLESTLSTLAEHLLDLFVVYLNIYRTSEFLDFTLVAYSRCSILWNHSEVFRELLLTFSMMFNHPVTSTKLQQAAFKFLSRTIEPTDKRFMEELAFGEHPDLCKISPFLLEALVLELFPQDIALPHSPSSLFLASLLLPPQRKTDPLRLLSTYPNEREISATDGDSNVILSTAFFTPVLGHSNRIYIPSLADICYSKEYFSRALMLHRIDLGQELKHEFTDVAKRLAPAPPRWARMGCWLAPGSPSLIEISECALGEFLPAWISLSLEIILPPNPDVADEWESLKKGDLLFMMHVQQNAEMLGVKACELQGFLSTDGKVLESLDGLKRKRSLESSKAERRILVVKIFPENVEEKGQFSNFNVLVRRDPKCIPIKFFLKALRHQAIDQTNISILQNHFKEFPSKRVATLATPFSSALDITLDTINRPVVVLGPPGSGKTQFAAKIALSLYEKDQREKILLVTQNHATLDVLLKRLVDMIDFSSEVSKEPPLMPMKPSHLIRLGSSSTPFAMTDSLPSPLTASGRLALIDERRIELLNLVSQMARSLGMDTADHGATCDSAETFFLTILPSEIKSDPYVVSLFAELRRLRPLEVLPSQNERMRYLLAHEARMVAATITQIIRSSEIKDVPLPNFSAIIVDNASTILDSELALIAALFPSSKRMILIGDHMMLPPVVHSPMINEQASIERSLYANLIRRYEGGAMQMTERSPISILPQRWRCRDEIAALFSWRYKRVNDVPPLKGNNMLTSVPKQFDSVDNMG